jgi:outer membrane lipoprotein-sorting protein
MQSRMLSYFVLLTAQAAFASESPQAILDHMRSVYSDMSSYSDTGTVVHEISPTSRDTHHFTTLFNRAPRHFLFDMRKQNDDRLVIWGDPDAFHVWWKTTQQTTDYPNPKNTGAITLSDYPTGGAITKIPVLLYAKANMSGALTHFEPDGSQVTESIMGHPCVRLNGKASDFYGESGKQVNVRKVVVWIDTKTYLLRQILEDPPAAPGMLDRTTTTFDPTANPTLPEDHFKFTPPRQ